MEGTAVLAVAVGVLGSTVACGGGDSGGSAGTRDSDARYEGSFTVLEDAGHGPELCDAATASDPPQCRGPPLVGWDWAAVEGEETSGDTTWGGWHVTGTYDGELAAVRDELADDEAGAALGPVGIAGTDERRGVVTATVWVADDAAITYADRRWGNLVDLQALLEPVD